MLGKFDGVLYGQKLENSALVRIGLNIVRQRSHTVKITSVQSAERFDNTEFSNEVVDGMALPLTAAYTCPQCGAQVGFHKSDFPQLSFQRHSNLQPELERAFDDYAREHAVTARDFLDGLCPSCRMAVRVYVKIWAGGNHGDSGARLAIVLEAESSEHETHAA